MKALVTFLLTKHPADALGFYRDTLGLEFVRDDGFALVFQTHGVMLRIGKVEEFAPAQNTVLGWESGNIEKTVRSLQEKGVVFEHYAPMQQDALGIQTFPNGDKVAWFKDPDGNVLSISQHAEAR
jgi:catechol 2,3-dioxygenase-like lactoylglutathione lyase family enzyme